MIRRLAKKVLNRVLESTPRVPNAPATGRVKPTAGEEWRAKKEASDPSPIEDEENQPEVEVEVEAHTLVEWIAEGRDPLFVDIREKHELYSGYVKGAKLIRMNDVPNHLDELPRDRPLILYCAAGMRSFSVAHWLRDQGFHEAWSLVNGISAWLATGAAYEQPERDS